MMGLRHLWRQRGMGCMSMRAGMEPWGKSMLRSWRVMACPCRASQALHSYASHAVGFFQMRNVWYAAGVASQVMSKKREYIYLEKLNSLGSRSFTSAEVSRGDGTEGKARRIPGESSITSAIRASSIHPSAEEVDSLVLKLLEQEENSDVTLRELLLKTRFMDWTELTNKYEDMLVSGAREKVGVSMNEHKERVMHDSGSRSRDQGGADSNGIDEMQLNGNRYEASKKTRVAHAAEEGEREKVRAGTQRDTDRGLQMEEVKETVLPILRTEDVRIRDEEQGVSLIAKGRIRSRRRLETVPASPHLEVEENVEREEEPEKAREAHLMADKKGSGRSRRPTVRGRSERERIGRDRDKDGQGVIETEEGGCGNGKEEAVSLVGSLESGTRKRRTVQDMAPSNGCVQDFSLPLEPSDQADGNHIASGSHKLVKEKKPLRKRKSPEEKVQSAKELSETDRLSDPIGGKRIVVTGQDFGPFSRDEMEEFVKQRGGILQQSVNGRTSMIVRGQRSYGQKKLEKSTELKIQVFDHSEFLKLFEDDVMGRKNASDADVTFTISGRDIPESGATHQGI